MFGTLYIVATPIGNLGDMTVRAMATLKQVNLILCEDTRVTKKLLSHFEITTPTKSYHQYSNSKTVQEIIELLKGGSNLALVTDAGTPGISDPGNMLVAEVVKTEPAISIVSVPGSCAATAALSVSGFPTDKFIFMGFPPHKNKRKKFFTEISEAKYTVVFYESGHRIKKAIEEMSIIMDKTKDLCICRELTKKFETVYRGSIEEILKMDISEKGEFVVVVRGKR